MNKVVAVVVTYNRKDKLIENIKHLLKQTVSTDVLIIDNASTDGTYDEISKFLGEQVKYINTGANLGGAGGFSFGMRKAVEAGYDYIWIMDDDCYPCEDALYYLFEADRELNGEYGFLSSKALWTDNSLCNMNIQRTSIRKKITSEMTGNVEIIMATFVSAFFKASVVKEIGLPIKEFFIWADDLEYTRRISKKYKGYFVTNSVVCHAMGSNNKVNIANDSLDRIGRYSYLYRNEVYIYRREGIVGMTYLFIRVVYHLLKTLIMSREGRKEKINTIWKSYLSGFSFKPEIEYCE